MSNTTFKDKNIKYSSFCNNVLNKSRIVHGTLDSKHKEKLIEFEKKENNINKLKNKIDKLNDDINNTNDLIEKDRLKTSLIEYKTELDYLENTTNELSYFDDNIDILLKYYTDKEEENEKPVEIKPENIIDLFNNTKKTKKNSKSDLFNNYLLRTCHIDMNPEKRINICKICNKDMTLNQQEGLIVCELCGNSQFILIDSDKPNYKDPSIENKINGSGYKRMNHFSELLNQFQGKENTDIPNEIYERILEELNKQRITDMSKVTNKTLRATLKKLGLNSYYEHIPYIINKLSGIPAPCLTRELEEKLRQMFREVQEPFMLFKNKSRKNFLNSHYVFHKLFELLERDDFTVFFPFLKSRTKLQEHDEVWKKICEFNNWSFLSSI